MSPNNIKQEKIMKRLGLIAFILGVTMINLSFTLNTEKIGVLILAHGGKLLAVLC